MILQIEKSRTVYVYNEDEDWDNFIPTRVIREYDMKFRESVRLLIPGDSRPPIPVILGHLS